MSQSLQNKYAANSICYGCGPANAQGLKIESFVEGENVIAHFQPQLHHQAFPNVLNGGIIGTLLDCHCNWAASWYLMQHYQLPAPPCTVTAEYTIKLLRPTPVQGPLKLVARLLNTTGKRALVHGELLVQDKVCAVCEATFVMVDESHPAFHRW